MRCVLNVTPQPNICITWLVKGERYVVVVVVVVVVVKIDSKA